MLRAVYRLTHHHVWKSHLNRLYSSWQSNSTTLMLQSSVHGKNLTSSHRKVLFNMEFPFANSDNIHLTRVVRHNHTWNHNNVVAHTVSSKQIFRDQAYKYDYAQASVGFLCRSPGTSLDPNYESNGLQRGSREADKSVFKSVSEPSHSSTFHHSVSLKQNIYFQIPAN